MTPNVRVFACLAAIGLSLSVSGAAGQPSSEHEPLSDAQIREFIEHALQEADLLEGSLTVRVSDRVVTLDGMVPNVWAKEKVVEVAFEVPDVEEVVSELTIATAESDQDLANQLGEKIRQYAFYTVFDEISGSVNRGVVTLTGWVTMPFKATQIEEMAAKILGTQEVRNQLEVLPTSSSDDRLRDVLSRRIYGDSLFQRYAFQSHPPIHIIVANGRVTLTGVVFSNIEKLKAEQIARNTFGVLSVENRLRLER